MGPSDNIIERYNKKVLPLIFVIETSVGMNGNRIAAVNTAIEGTIWIF